VWFGAFMRRHSGASDFRLIAGNGLTWIEQAGLTVAVANFTVFPGAFCWHVKGLFGQGILAQPTHLVSISIGLLQITWFFSSLYLWSLYFVLFFGARRGPSREVRGFSSYTYVWRVELQRIQPWVTTVTQGSGLLRGLLCLGAVGLVWHAGLAGLLFFETMWAEKQGATLFGYY
jgi:hypothetical protein